MEMLMNPMSMTDLLLGSLPTIALILIIWLVPAFLVMSHIRRHNIDETAKAVWILITLLLPIVGPVAYWLLNKGEKK